MEDMEKELLIMLLMFFWLLGLSLSDIRDRRVPVWMIMTGGLPVVGITVFKCVWGENNAMAFFTGMIPGMVFLMLAIGTKKAGWADGIILMLLGCVLGFRRCVLLTLISLILISILSALLLILKKADKGTTIPYVPFLTIGFVLCGLIGG